MTTSMPTAPLSIFTHFLKCVSLLGALSPARFIPLRLPCLPEKAHYCECYDQLTCVQLFGVFGVRQSCNSCKPQLPVFTLPHHTHIPQCCPARHFGGNQLPDSSIGLSPLHPASAIDLNVRIAQVLPPAFPQASYQPGIVHRLSGQTQLAKRCPLAS